MSTSKLKMSIKSKDHLLLLTGSMMRKYSKKYCRGSFLKGEQLNCEWYHASWSYARLVGLAVTPDWHACFYKDFFSRIKNNNHCNILITGTADYGILDHLLRAIPIDIMANITITVLDLCRTPLEICKWYEKKFNISINIRYVRGDAQETKFPDYSFDMITSYCFLQRFDEIGRKRLVEEWQRLLKPNGCIITTARIISTNTFKKKIPMSNNLNQHTRRILKFIDANKPWLRPMAGTISNLTYGYIKNIFSYAIPSEKYLYSLFRDFDCTIQSDMIHSEFEGEKIYAPVFAVNKQQS